MAQTAGFNEDVIVAAFLHDIGHICAPDDAPHMDTDGGKDVGVVDHESIGKELLQVLGFSTFVTDLVESHVPSKKEYMYLPSSGATFESSVIVAPAAFVICFVSNITRSTSFGYKCSRCELTIVVTRSKICNRQGTDGKSSNKRSLPSIGKKLFHHVLQRFQPPFLCGIG